MLIIDIWWKAYVDDAASQRSLTDALLHTTFLEAKKKGNPKYALASFDVYSAYGQLLSPDRRYTDKMELNGGFTGISFNGLPIVPDYDAPYDEVYFIDPSTLSVEDLAPISFLNEDGSILDRSSTTPAWNAKNVGALLSNQYRTFVKLLETLVKLVSYNVIPEMV